MHDQRLHQVLQRLEQWGFRLQLAKCHFYKPSVKYLGHKINDKGISADSTQIQAIETLRKPNNQKDVQSILGLINYYGKFVNDLHKLKAPLEELLQKNSTFKWWQKHDEVFKQIKSVLTSPLLLAHFDPRQKLIVAADACQTGIGGVLLQRYPDGNEKAVFHMSKALTQAQKNYSQIEKEALALVTAVERFHKFVWGRKFVLQTNHRPLLALFNQTNGKRLSERTAARLRRWALRLIGYEFDIEYVRTNEFGHADALSRLIQQTRQDAQDPEFEQVIASIQIDQDLADITTEAMGSNSARKQLRISTQNDATLSNLIKRTQTGWTQDDLKNEQLAPYYRIAESITLIDGILLYGKRVIIPNKLRKAVLNRLHRGHPGIRRMKNLARYYFFWPGMSTEIQKLVKSCSHCAQTTANPVKEPLHPWPDAMKPWSRIFFLIIKN